MMVLLRVLLIMDTVIVLYKSNLQLQYNTLLSVVTTWLLIGMLAAFRDLDVPEMFSHNSFVNTFWRFTPTTPSK